MMMVMYTGSLGATGTFLEYFCLHAHKFTFESSSSGYN